MDGDMQNLGFEALEHENLREAFRARRRDVILERLTRHNIEAGVA
jgi:hypothetical protein